MTILILGDLYYNYSEVREDVRALGGYFADRKYHVIPNLEGGVGNPADKKIFKRGSCLKQNGCIAEVLKTLGVKGVTLANNHMMDFGAEGLAATLKMLDDNEIAHTGAGSNMPEALKPMEISGGGRTTAVFNFGWDAEETVYAENARPGCAPRDNTVILKVLSEYAEKHPENAIIPVLHWGFEKNLYPMPYDIDLAHRICEIDAVKTVIGHHPHCPQPLEIYKGKKIYYSLGNFYFGKSRIKYADKLYNHDPADMSDYGIGVTYDTESGETGDIVFFYDKEKDETVIKEDGRIPVKMPEITDMKSYEELIRSTRLAKNPVLYTSPVLNYLKIWGFNTKRNLFRLGILK